MLTAAVLSFLELLPLPSLRNNRQPQIQFSKGAAMKKFIQNFLRCGLAGWCMEVIFTALHSLRRRDMRLQGTTSLWMFPIYGSAALLEPVSRLLHSRTPLLRGLTYMTLIFSTEYFTGTILQRHCACPWDYKQSRWNINRIIRLDYAPYWFLAGLFFEWLLSHGATAVSLKPNTKHGIFSQTDSTA